MKIQNALVSNILYRSQRYFAHVTTVTLSWRVQNIVVIGRLYFTLDCFEFSSNFEFDRNMLSGTGARPHLWLYIRTPSCRLIWQHIFPMHGTSRTLIFYFFGYYKSANIWNYSWWLAYIRRLGRNEIGMRYLEKSLLSDSMPSERN